jgi:hypothetical protein
MVQTCPQSRRIKMIDQFISCPYAQVKRFRLNTPVLLACCHSEMAYFAVDPKGCLLANKDKFKIQPGIHESFKQCGPPIIRERM